MQDRWGVDQLGRRDDFHRIASRRASWLRSQSAPRSAGSARIRITEAFPPAVLVAFVVLVVLQVLGLRIGLCEPLRLVGSADDDRSGRNSLPMK